MSVATTATASAPGEALRGRWSVKYYKGLGTSTSAEGRAYFGALARHRKAFTWGGASDGDAIDMAFNKERAEDRKAWLSAREIFAAGEGSGGGAEGVASSPATAPAGAAATAAEAGAFVELESVSFGAFIHRELIEFSLADLARSIPSALDGLKPSQRKVLFACFMRTGGGAARGAAARAQAAAAGAEAERDSGADEALAAEGGGAEGIATAASPATSASASASAAAAAAAAAAAVASAASASATGSEIKVAQLAGFVAEHTAYHHGEAALTATIAGMAQDFVGSNNVNVLVPQGQFGTRLQGGKDAASARYIFTRLSPLARLLFPAADDALLARREDDGDRVEPVAYLPVVPLVLVNGAAGIGTGWSTGLPMHHPVAVADATRLALDRGWHEAHAARGSGGASGVATAAVAAAAAAADEASADAAVPLVPWWRGFSGAVERSRPGAAYEEGFVTHGAAEVDEEGGAGGGDESPRAAGGGGGGGVAVRVRELPVGRWTEDYKLFLQGLVAEGQLVRFREYHSERSVDFALVLAAEATDRLGLNGGLSGPRAAEALRRFLKLSAPVSTRNMHLFDARGRIRRFASPWDVVREYAPARAALYAARRVRINADLAAQLARAGAKARFLADVVAGRLVVSRRPRAEIERDLRERGFPTAVAVEAAGDPAYTATEAALVRNYAHLIAARESAGGGGAVAPPAPPLSASVSAGFDYLLGLPLSQLSAEALTRTERAAAAAAAALEVARRASLESLWRADLDALRVALVAEYGEPGGGRKSSRAAVASAPAAAAAASPTARRRASAPP